MKTINRNLKIVVVSLISCTFAAFVWYIITLISAKVGINLSENLIINVSGIEISILISQYFVIKKFNNGKFSFDFIDMKFQKNSFKQVFIGIGMGILMCFTWILTLSVIKAIKIKGMGFMLYPEKKIIIDIIDIFIISVLGSLTEEILYRGIILKQLAEFKGKNFALIISALIFTLLHSQYYQYPSWLLEVFIMGIFLGYLYMITGSLYLSIGLHFAADFFPSITSNTLLLYDVNINNSDMILYDSYVRIFAVLILALGLGLYRCKNKKILI